MKTQKEKQFEKYETMMSVFGELDENIEKLTDAFDVDVFALGAVFHRFTIVFLVEFVVCV